jgi:O-succinylbenzoic acid--CoA ligase
MKQLRAVSSHDTFAALQLMTEIADGEVAGFIAADEIPSDLPNEVSDSTALVVESSGSTGIPKRINLSLSALKHSALASSSRLGGDGQWLLALPANFIAGANVLFRSVMADTQPVIMNTRVPFTTEAFIRGASLMEGARRYTSLVPSQLGKLSLAAESDAFVYSMLRKFDAILVGGQQPVWSDVESLRAKGINLVVSYGMTETCGGCVYDGVPLDGVKYQLNDGVISLSGPVLAEGLSPWFQTSDLGEEVQGKLHILGRADRVIISGGLKISLDRVEQVAREIIGVSEVIAAPVASEWGESVGLVYSGSPEAEFSSLEQVISVGAKPKKVVRVDEIPRLASGKPDLIKCRELLEQ